MSTNNNSATAAASDKRSATKNMHQGQPGITELLMQQLHPAQLALLGGGNGESKPPAPAQRIKPADAADSQFPQQQSPTPVKACVAQAHHSIEHWQPHKQRLGDWSRAFAEQVVAPQGLQSLERKSPER